MQAKWMLAALGAFSLALPLHAADTASNPTLSSLAADYNVQTSDIQNLRDKGWSWNEIGDALAVSKRADRPLQEILAQRDSGMSWNQISERYGFKFGDVSSEARRVAKDARRANKKEMQAVRPAGRAAPPAAPTKKPAENPSNPGNLAPSETNPPAPSTP